MCAVGSRSAGRSFTPASWAQHRAKRKLVSFPRGSHTNKASCSGEELFLFLRLERNVSGVGEKLGKEEEYQVLNTSVPHTAGQLHEASPYLDTAVEPNAKAQFRKRFYESRDCDPKTEPLLVLT